ncbi:major facilitator superfamily transporter [Seiridium cupressi]
MSFENPRASPERPSATVDSEASTIRGQNESGNIAQGNGVATKVPSAHATHPRDGISRYRWIVMICGNLLLSMIGGYDTSNVANVQVPIYKAFDHIGLLPWVSLSYSLTGVAIIPLARKLTSFCDLKWMGLASCVLTCVASALIGAAPNIESVIVGRVLMAIGSVTVYQIILSYNVIFARPHELALVQALVGAFFAIGLISGPIIGGAFAENEHATWRWAFYAVIPTTSAASLLLMFYPSYRAPTNKAVSQHLREIDWVGCILWIGIFVLFGLASVFPGPTWEWNSAPAIAVWTLFGVVTCVFFIQQYLALFTSAEYRAFPVYLLSKRSVVFPSLCVCMAGVTYGTTLYYTPIYFAFTRGQGALAAAVRLLPFICVFIFMIFLSGGLLPAVRYYKVFFLLGAVLVLIGGGLQQTITSQSSEGSVMGFETIAAAGLGLMWQISLPISSVVLPPHERMDAAALFNMGQMGGVSIALAIAGAIYENVGFRLVSDVVSGMGFSSHDIRELLSGADSPVLSALEPGMLGLIVDTVTKAIVSCFYLTLAAGAICFIAACCMKFEALEFKKPEAAATPASWEREQERKRESMGMWNQGFSSS